MIVLEPLAWIPATDPLGRIQQMPDLVAELAALGQTRNPDGDARALTRSVPGPRPPARIDSIDILDRPGGQSPPLLEALVLYVSRPIWEAFDPDTRTAHPQPLGTPTWARECAWLTGVWAESRSILDAADMAMVDDELATIYAEVAQAVSLYRPRLAMTCPQCGAAMELVGEGLKAVFVCTATRWQADRHEEKGPAALELEWRYHPPMTRRQLLAKLGDSGLTAKKLDNWCNASRKLKPVARGGGRGRQNTYWPWDVVRLMWPAIADAIDERDAA